MIKQRNYQLFEIFEEVQNAKTEAQQIKILQKHKSFELEIVLRAAFRPTIKFDLPYGAPPFRPDDGDPEQSMNRMSTVVRELGLLIRGDTRLDSLRKETKFIGILESVNVKNAKVLVAMKDKELGKLYPNLTVDLINKAFPGVI